MWQNIQFNPTTIINKETNSNPMIPNFFYGPKFKELYVQNEDNNCEQKVTYFLKKELEEYRNT